MKKDEIYWTLCNFGTAYMFIQIGYFGLESLQSTLNFRSGLGTTCVGVLNGCAVISNLFIGPLVVRRLSPKWTLFASFLAHTVYIIANYFPSWATLVPASALVGLTQSMNGIVYGVYITSLSCYHSAAVANQRRLRHKENDVIHRTASSADSDIEVSDPLMTLNDSKSKSSGVNSKPLVGKTKMLQAEDQSNRGSLDKQDCNSLESYESASDDGNRTNLTEQNDIGIYSKENELNNIRFNYDKSSSRKKHDEDESGGFEAESDLEELTVGESDFDDPATQKTFARFNSIIITFLTVGGLLGNITSSLVLGRSGPSVNETGNLLKLDDIALTAPLKGMSSEESQNLSNRWTSISPTEQSILLNFSSTTPQKICGIDHCPALLEQEGNEIVEPERYLVYIMLSIYLVCNIVGLVLTAFLRPMYNERGRALEQTATVADKEIREDGSSTSEEKGVGGCSGLCFVLGRLTDTLRLLGNVRLLLTVIPMFWIGVVMSLTVGAFNQSFVGCSLGVAYVGYAMTSLRLMFVVTSHVSARLLHCLHRRYLILSSMLLQLLIVGSWFALPSYEGAGVLITCCALIGCSFGIFKTVFYGLFPLLFPDQLENALAHNSMWECMGLSAAFIASDYLCFRLKAYISIGLTVLSMLSYSTLEVIIRPRKSTAVEEDSSDAVSRS